MLITNCKRCGRPLKNEESIKRGLGPYCYKKSVKEFKEEQTKLNLEMKEKSRKLA